MLSKPEKNMRCSSCNPGDYRPGLPPAGSQRGQAIVEFAIAFPLQLMIMLFIMQLALIYTGRQVVTYAAYQAARSAAVAGSQDEAYFRAHRAASMICAPITGPTIRGATVSPSDIRMAAMELPGWGEIPKSGVSSRVKTHLSHLEFIPPNEVEVTVTHYYELTLPVVGFLVGTFMGRPAPQTQHGIGREGSGAGSSEMAHEYATGIWNIRAPHMRIRSTARVAMPRIVE